MGKKLSVILADRHQNVLEGWAANYQSAIDQLTSILDKTDGCALRGIPDTTDWVITCASQALIDPLIRDCITMLQTLLQES